MVNTRRPYLIVPKLIEQKTWGGDYIEKLKGLESNQAVAKYQIGQSYELFSGTKLLLAADNDSGTVEMGFANKESTVEEIFTLKKDDEYINLTDLITINPEEVLGKRVMEKYAKMPLLLKLTQAKGNSFQIHIKPGVDHEKWKPKPETWYYLEKGKLTCGVKPGISLSDYKSACLEIEKHMEEISMSIVTGKTSLDEARNDAAYFVKNIDPWQFVQTKMAVEGDVFDMSLGGIHHSWEEDSSLPLGNVVFEVQLDVMDPVATIRAFDQGKIGDNGTIREVNIEDYFRFLDTDENLNKKGFWAKRDGINNVFTTRDYSMDVLEIIGDVWTDTNSSFAHFYVKTGEVIISGGEGEVKLGAGESCFVPQILGRVRIKSDTGARVFKTYVPII